MIGLDDACSVAAYPFSHCSGHDCQTRTRKSLFYLTLRARPERIQLDRVSACSMSCS